MDTPEHHAMRSEQRRALERAIQELPEDMRSAVVLRDIQGCSYDEIADVLDANVGHHQIAHQPAPGETS